MTIQRHKRTGRPPLGENKRKHKSVYLTPHTMARLERLAEACGGDVTCAGLLRIWALHALDHYEKKFGLGDVPCVGAKEKTSWDVTWPEI